MKCPNCGSYRGVCHCTWTDMWRAMEQARQKERRQRREERDRREAERRAAKGAGMSETTAGGLLWEAMDDEGRKSQLIAMTKRAADLTARLAAAEADNDRIRKQRDDAEKERHDALERLAEVEAERDVERRDRTAAEFELLAARDDLTAAEAKSTAEYKRGFIDGLTEYAWWKDGVQYVGSCGTTLEQAIERIQGTKGEE